MSPPLPDPNYDDALGELLRQLRQKAESHSRGPPIRDSFDIDVYHFGLAWAQSLGYVHDHDVQGRKLVILLLEAAWELVRRGILRPGTKTVPDANIGNTAGFCLTLSGREWLANAHEDHFLVFLTKPLVRAFADLEPFFGMAFVLRAHEAVQCRDAGCYLACCAMSGAAAEAILLALATAKSGNSDEVLRVYNGSQGRKRTIDLLVGQAQRSLADQFRSYIGIIASWRDDAAHGAAVTISLAQAEETIRQLISMAQFSAKRWGDLTGTSAPS